MSTKFEPYALESAQLIKEVSELGYEELSNIMDKILDDLNENRISKKKASELFQFYDVFLQVLLENDKKNSSN